MSDIKQSHLTALRAAACAALLIGAGAAAGTPAPAPTPSKHQLIKDCMRKQKEAGTGKLNEDMKAACREMAGTEKQNEKAEKKQPEQRAPVRP